MATFTVSVLLWIKHLSPSWGRLPGSSVLQGPAAEADEMRWKENSFLLGDTPCNLRKGVSCWQTTYPQVDLVQGYVILAHSLGHLH